MSQEAKCMMRLCHSALKLLVMQANTEISVGNAQRFDCFAEWQTLYAFFSTVAETQIAGACPCQEGIIGYQCTPLTNRGAFANCQGTVMKRDVLYTRHDSWRMFHKSYWFKHERMCTFFSKEKKIGKNEERVMLWKRSMTTEKVCPATPWSQHNHISFCTVTFVHCASRLCEVVALLVFNWAEEYCSVLVLWSDIGLFLAASLTGQIAECESETLSVLQAPHQSSELKPPLFDGFLSVDEDHCPAAYLHRQQGKGSPGSSRLPYHCFTTAASTASSTANEREQNRLEDSQPTKPCFSSSLFWEWWHPEFQLESTAHGQCCNWSKERVRPAHSHSIATDGTVNVTDHCVTGKGNLLWLSLIFNLWSWLCCLLIGERAKLVVFLAIIISFL